MTRTWLRDWLWLALGGLLVNLLAARFITHPGYVDAYYYFGGAKQLARGLGFSEPYQWNYLAAELPGVGTMAPWPSHLYWMPLTSILAASFMAAAESLAGEALPQAALFRAAQWPSLLAASALPLVSYSLALRWSGKRRHAVAAAALTLFAPFYLAYWPNTDAFALHALAAAGALLAAASATEAARGGRWWALVAGVCGGLAHLARADGVLVVLVSVAWLVAVRRRQGLWLAGVAVAGYLVALAPWFWRNVVEVGRPLAGGTQTLWLREYNELFNYPAGTLTVTHFLGAGWTTILQSKWAALRDNLISLAVVQGGVAAFPFALVGLWGSRRRAEVGLGTLYGLALLALMSLAFSFPGARGGYFHSGAALLPWLMAAAPLGLDRAVEAVARRLPHWRPEKSKPVFTALLVLGTIGMALAMYVSRVIGAEESQTAWDRQEAAYREAAAWMATNGAEQGLTVVNNPPGWYYWSDRPGIAIPNGDSTTLLRVMEDYGARWVLLDHNFPQGLAALYEHPNSVPQLTVRAEFGGGGAPTLYLMERVPTQ